MTTSEGFKSIIEDDIAKCKYEIENGSIESCRVLHRTLKSKYGKIIDGFNDGLLDLFYDSDGIYCKRNLETMRQKFLLFQAMGYENSFSGNAEKQGLTINNTNSLGVSIAISFSEVKDQVENMTALKEEEVQEVLEKIDELETIVKSNERKTKKWERAKEIIKWIADKSVDVGIAMLPLIMKIGQ